MQCFQKARSSSLATATALMTGRVSLRSRKSSPTFLPVAALSPVMIAGFLSFGLMALLYLVTEELLVEAHEKPDTPLISSMFFVGFLALLTLEEMMG